jgi:hypothetical protein
LHDTPLPVTAFRGLTPTVEVPAGRSGRLELVYRPTPLLFGGAIAGASAVALLAAAFALRKTE